ncbi:outer membrane protein transport protein, partial [candidate division KSB1 bacterium]|nr:outer membrane protein transport protein [candidate division KSB1 bacterium]
MRKMNSILAMITILGVLWSTHLFAAGVDLTAIGARAQALGGNYRGVSDDWSAMYWNPAGLVFTSGLKAGFGLEFASPSATYTAGKSQLGGPFSATKFGKAVENEPLNFVLPSLGVYYSNEKYAFGIGAWAPFGLGAKWNLLDTDAYNSNYPEFEWEDNMQVIDIHPTFSYKINE